jgi:hypothetical protein
MLYDTHGHAYTHHIGITILLSSFLLTLLPPFLAGRLVQTLPVSYTTFPAEWDSLAAEESVIPAAYSIVAGEPLPRTKFILNRSAANSPTHTMQYFPGLT